MRVRANFLVKNGKDESVQVFGLEAEAFLQALQKPVAPINTMLLYNNRKTNSGGGNEIAVFMLLSVEVHVAESKLKEPSFQFFSCFLGSANQKKVFCFGFWTQNNSFLYNS